MARVLLVKHIYVEDQEMTAVLLENFCPKSLCCAYRKGQSAGQIFCYQFQCLSINLNAFPANLQLLACSYICETIASGRLSRAAMSENRSSATDTARPVEVLDNSRISRGFTLAVC
jgi:hypothetical protein